MSIADVQARSLMAKALRGTADMVERQIDIPFERASDGIFVILDGGRTFTDAATGQKFYTLVYGMVSETKEDIEALARSLIGPDAE